MLIAFSFTYWAALRVAVRYASSTILEYIRLDKIICQGGLRLMAIHLVLWARNKKTNKQNSKWTLERGAKQKIPPFKL